MSTGTKNPTVPMNLKISLTTVGQLATVYDMVSNITWLVSSYNLKGPQLWLGWILKSKSTKPLECKFNIIVHTKLDIYVIRLLKVDIFFLMNVTFYEKI